MGSLVSCLSDPCQSGNGSPPPQARRRSSTSSRGRGGGGGGRDSAKASVTIDEEALAAAAALVLGQRGGGAFERSASVRYAAKRHGQGPPLPRSCSTRPRSLADPELQPQQLLAKVCSDHVVSRICYILAFLTANSVVDCVLTTLVFLGLYNRNLVPYGSFLEQDLNTKDLETSVIVLVHGGGFGAWCWYKTISLLEDSGFRVNAIDLTGSGIHSYDTNKICSLSEYAEPLTSYLEGLGDAEKVILVAHDLGGACVSYAMEMFPTKVAKAVFLCAAMLTNGNSALDMFQQQDVSLASVSMRPIPFAPVLEKLVLTAENYGSVRRFYVETTEDNAIPLPLQQSMCGANPPEKVLRLKGADHAPFFSKPQALHKTLVEIAAMPPVGAS
ncbi:Putative methylesterase 11 chloroplastic [Zea mays]|uniref:Putative methylesterase 11 chloroplastic n=1 Tax=Zea mays TaxID=4577 RepID=A0A1D6IJ12_MAIZE|nr:Putative methylesterase 11 chloroplastic [Zea mays]